MKNKLLTLILFITILSACKQPVEQANEGAAEQVDHTTENTPDDTSEQTVENKTELDYELDALRLMPFLAVHDDAIAAAWLSLQDSEFQKTSPQNSNSQAEYQPTLAHIAQYETRIQQLAKQLKEDRRIIANRTVQMRDLLTQSQMHENLIHLLDGMIEVSRAGVEGDYGSYCQWYINLRESHFSHQETIDKMKALK